MLISFTPHHARHRVPAYAILATYPRTPIPIAKAIVNVPDGSSATSKKAGGPPWSQVGIPLSSAAYNKRFGSCWLRESMKSHEQFLCTEDRSGDTLGNRPQESCTGNRGANLDRHGKMEKTRVGKERVIRTRS